MKAIVISSHITGKMMEIKVANDPFPSTVEYERVEAVNKERMMPKTATTKELRNKARQYGLDGWEDMDRDELAAAVEEWESTQDVDEDVDEEEDEDTEEEAPRPAKKASKTTKKAPAKAAAKKAPAKKATAAKKAAPAKRAAKATTKKAVKVARETEQEGPNPFREGSNLYLFCQELMKGGRRDKMVERLLKKVELKPRKRGGRGYDPAAEIDYRLVRVCQLLSNDYDFVIEKEGRGPQQKVQAIAPEDQ